MRHVYAGACHCGNVAVRLYSDETPEELGVRTDTCSVCTMHQARYTSDPEGSVELVVHDDGRLQRYRFGTRTADFLIFLACPLQVADLDGETLEQRLARRRARWTPVRR